MARADRIKEELATLRLHAGISAAILVSTTAWVVQNDPSVLEPPWLEWGAYFLLVFFLAWIVANGMLTKRKIRELGEPE